MKRSLMILFLLAAVALKLSGQEIPRLTLPLMLRPPVIDGKINAEEWKYAAGMYGSCYISHQMKGQRFPAEMKFWVGADRKNLYIATRCEVGPSGILQRMLPSENANVNTFVDDSIETVIIPDFNAKQRSLYHSNINNRGAVYRIAKIGGNNQAFNGKWTVKGTVENGFWKFEMSIPWKDLGIADEKIPKCTGIRICRNWQRLAGNTRTPTAWEPVKTEYLTDHSIPVIDWRADSPVVQVVDTGEYTGSAFKAGRMTVFNPSGKEIKVKVDYHFHPQNSHDFRLGETYAVKPGETRLIELEGGPATPAEQVTWKLKVSSSDAKQIYYLREYRMTGYKPKEVFASSKGDEQRVNFNFAHYPSYRKIIFRADLSNMSGKIPELKAVIRHKNETVAEVELPAPGSRKTTMLEWNTPDFSKYIPANENSAKFEVDLLTDGKKVITQKFEYNIFPWTGNMLGKSDVVVPPFTQIEYRNNTVGVLLRNHKLNSLGLPEQIEADGKNILKGHGVILEVTIDGKTYQAQGRLRMTEQGKSYLKTASEWRAGTLSGLSEALWDQDGMLKWTLTLKSGVRTEALRLIIPLDDAQMPLMHTCGDGARINYGGSTPDGSGKIWDSTKIARIGLTDYVPYIWLGGDYRGFSVFGDNDKGWIPDAGHPEFELFRDNGKLTLMLNLIGKPAELKTERKITLGFMATPVKPMPENWRRWNAWSYRSRSIIPEDFVYQFNFLGSGWYFGAETACADVYPRGEDLEILHKMAEARRTQMRPNSWIDEVWAPKHLKPNDPKNKSVYLPHIRNGFNRAMAKGDEVLFYFNARGARFKSTPEGRHFLNEWYRHAVADREIMDGVAYDVDPVESYRDYAVYWYKKILETGAMDQMYWDDLFLSPNSNLVGTDAYLREDGAIQPSAGIFNMRELVRRSAFMLAELGRRPRFMLHMTSTNTAPILSYGAMNFDWEENKGLIDFQDRNPREYIRTMSTGRQVGNFPVMLVATSVDFKKVPPAQYNHWIRTAAGVMLTHELRWHKNYPEFWQTLKRLFDFGYGKEGAVVYNYWDNSFPVSFPGKETSALVTVKGDSAQIMVCDWDEGGDYAMNIDPTKIKLRQGFDAINAETGEKLTVARSQVKFKLNKHDFIIIELK